MVSNSNSSPRSGNDDAQSIAELKHYAGYIIAAIVLALAGFFGFRYWQSHTVSPDIEAAQAYSAIQQMNDKVALAEQNPDLQSSALQAERSALATQVDKLVTAYPDSVYAWQALLLKARQQADSEDYKGASETLKRALDIPLKDAGLTAMTQLRYATTLLAAGDVDAALSAASKEMPNAFEPSKQELLGDIYLQQNKTQEAERAYENAWNLLVGRKEDRAILRLKMESIGIMPQEMPKKPALIASAPVSLSDVTVENAAASDANIASENVTDESSTEAEQTVDAASDNQINDSSVESTGQ
ncbi:YfgM family protein [Psychrobacter sp. I-STPA10]|uniref:YfgM family protein n=1 Tax=Psychrobacter sp. I-STPA10 TaxID=2585769 RepID=UPI001E3D3AC6|nr:tetratricopeptide repeat protein [Psychrobacter sp. I-STPA10]